MLEEKVMGIKYLYIFDKGWIGIFDNGIIINKPYI